MFELKSHDPAPQHTLESLGFGIISHRFELSRSSLKVPFLAWPFKEQFLARRCLHESFLQEMLIATVRDMMQ